MAVTEEEKNRELSSAEERRLARFEEMATAYIAQGYRRVDLTIGIIKANVVTIVAAIPLVVLCAFLLHTLHPEAPYGLSVWEILIFAVCYVVLIVVHEFVHGLTWSFFAEHGFKDIEFGFMKQYWTPYCTCGAPLAKGPYVLGALMPLLVLGIVPTVIALCIGNTLLMWIGVIMIISAGGDVMIAGKLLTYKTSAQEVLFCDHPTQAGGVVFER